MSSQQKLEEEEVSQGNQHTPTLTIQSLKQPWRPESHYKKVTGCSWCLPNAVYKLMQP